MTLLLLRLLLAPALVVALSLAARRWGPAVGGVLTGLPVTAGPILLVVALDHGTRFAGRVATAATLGLLAVCAFLVVHALAARLAGALVSIGGAWLAFGAGLVVLSPLHVRAGPAYVAAFLAAALTAALVGRLAPPPPERPSPPPRLDLPARAAASAAMVLTLTLAAGDLGPHWAGLLTPAPIAASVLIGFAHAQDGAGQAGALARGFAAGLAGFGAFLALVAVTVRPYGIAGGFGVALAASLAVQAMLLGARSSHRFGDNPAPCPSNASPGS